MSGTSPGCFATSHRHRLEPSVLIEKLPAFVQVAALATVLFGGLTLGLQVELVAGGVPDAGTPQILSLCLKS
jgi:hypothetical protein